MVPKRESHKTLATGLHAGLGLNPLAQLLYQADALRIFVIGAACQGKNRKSPTARVRKPGFDGGVRRAKLWIIKTRAPPRSIMASATFGNEEHTAHRARPMLSFAGSCARPSFSDSLRSDFEACRAGARPKAQAPSARETSQGETEDRAVEPDFVEAAAGVARFGEPSTAARPHRARSTPKTSLRAGRGLRSLDEQLAEEAQAAGSQGGTQARTSLARANRASHR